MDLPLFLLLSITLVLSSFIFNNVVFFEPKISGLPISHNSLLSLLFLLQFCVYPWYLIFSGAGLEFSGSSSYDRNIEYALVLSFATTFYIIYYFLSLSLRGVKIIIPKWLNGIKFYKIKGRSLLYIYAIVYFFCFVLFVNFFLSFGGLSEFILLLGSYRSGQIPGTGVYTIPILVFCPVLAIYLIDYLKFEKNNNWKILLITLSICLPPLMIGFRVYAVIFLIQIFYMYRFEIMQHKKRFFLICLLIAIALGLYSSMRQALEVGYDSFDKSEFQEINRLEPLFRSKSIDMVSAALTCNCHAENIFEFFFEPINVIYNKLLKQDYISYGDRFTKDVLSFGVALDNYGGVNPNFLGFYYWLAGPLGIIFSIFIFSLIDIYLNTVKAYYHGTGNVFGAIIYSVIPVLFDSPVAAYSSVFNSISALILINILFPINWRMHEQQK